jgi:hypothetical protein
MQIEFLKDQDKSRKNLNLLKESWDHMLNQRKMFLQKRWEIKNKSSRARKCKTWNLTIINWFSFSQIKSILQFIMRKISLMLIQDLNNVKWSKGGKTKEAWPNALISIKRIILRAINLDQIVMIKPQELGQWMSFRSITTMKTWKKKRYCLINWRYRRIIVYLNLMKVISRCSLWLDLKLSFTILMSRWGNGKLGVGNVSKGKILNSRHAWKINI